MPEIAAQSNPGSRGRRAERVELRIEHGVPIQTKMSLTIGLLGGAKVFAREFTNQLDAHEVILAGFPNTALTHLVGSVPIMREVGVMEKALGISLRTYQRRNKENHTGTLNQEQSGRAWKFAEIFAKAILVLGSQDEAEAWLDRPAIGLNQQRPIDLLSTTAGVEIVEEHLERLEYGVYT